VMAVLTQLPAWQASLAQRSTTLSGLGIDGRVAMDEEPTGKVVGAAHQPTHAGARTPIRTANDDRHRCRSRRNSLSAHEGNPSPIICSRPKRKCTSAGEHLACQRYGIYWGIPDA
jgi:hypothetical protein